MNWKPEPQLVTIEGDDIGLLGEDPVEVAEFLGIDVEDGYLLTGEELTESDIAYLNAKYPELMGIWPFIAKIGGALIKGGAGIVKKIAGAVKKKRAAKKAASTQVKQEQEIKQAAIRQAQQMAVVEQQRKEGQKKNMMMIMIPVAGLAAIMLLKRK